MLYPVGVCPQTREEILLFPPFVVGRASTEVHVRNEKDHSAGGACWRNENRDLSTASTGRSSLPTLKSGLNGHRAGS